MNNLLKDVEGADDYSDFTTNGKRGNLIYKFNNNSDLSDFNYAGNTRKEARGEKRAEKGKSRKGTAFTINDDKVADELYRAVAGNSNVEYLKVGYKDNTNTDEKNLIETQRSQREIVPTSVGRLHASGKEIVDVTHSHPFNPNGVFSTKFASEADKNGYKSTYNVFNSDYKDDNLDYNMPKHKIYHPWTSDSSNLPHTMEYNQDGLILPGGKKLKDLRAEYDEILERYAGIKIERK